jgi:hypothetical protein
MRRKYRYVIMLVTPPALFVAILGITTVIILKRPEPSAPIIDVAGYWSTGIDYTGTMMKLEQSGDHVTGTGLFHSCVGSEHFLVEGRIWGNILHLDYRRKGNPDMSLDFRVRGNLLSYQYPGPREPFDEAGNPIYYLDELWHLDRFERTGERWPPGAVR